MGALSAGFRQSPHFFDRRILLGRSSKLLFRLGKSAAAKRRPNELDRVQRGRIAPDAGASLEPDSETDGRSGKAKLVLRPKQEQLLHLLREHKALTPREIWME
jgi:hypothetical protein